MAIASVNPATGEIIRQFEAHTESEVERALERGVRAFDQHRCTSFADRAATMQRLAGLLQDDIKGFARIISTEMGKIFQASVSEIEKCARCCRFYAEHGDEFLREQIVESDARQSSIRYQPLGIILAIMPWNFPFWQVFRFAAPAIMAGNVALLKHASNVSQCALAIESVFQKAGFQAGVFQTLLLPNERVEPLLKDTRIKAVTLTGSDRAGSAIASSAGRELKKSVLELGGSDPFIVMPSANLDDAVSTGVKARMVNSGQSCIAAKRFIIADPIYDRFVSSFVQLIKPLKLGDPFDAETELGPLASEDILRGVDKQVQISVAAGAKILTGGKRAGRPGFFYQPTVLTDIPKSSPAYREEVFGPVALMFRVRDAAEAVALANDSVFGLGSSVWTSNSGEQEFFARELESGMVFINAMVASDPRLPFGGVKRSGYGRELGAEGIREFTNIKTVYVGA
ncbi:MAG: succinate-semialdehyde dehydrogenase / glutarate-semialdehyde dehydrogenase [Verrucomicrobiota bacterium]|jgi:succinate-semialdehyde dehydrogenase/glutarate-semialdehyde dehydrogenase